VSQIDPKIHAALVTYKRPDDLARSLSAIQPILGSKIESLVIVDNDDRATARDVVDAFAVIHPEVRYLVAPTNLGPAGGWALAMDLILVTASDDDWVLILDDDDPLASQNIPLSLLDIASRCPIKPVGAVGLTGKIYGRLMFWEDETRHPNDEYRSVDSLDECSSLMLNVKAIREAGGFRRELFFGFEGLDLCLRLKRHGYAIIEAVSLFSTYRDPSRYLHKRGFVPRSTQLGPMNWKRYYSLRNSLVIIRENRGELVAAIHVMVRGVGKPLFFIARYPRLSLLHLRYNLRAIVDAYLGRLGKRHGLPN
jgi:GT2 family glycosyltransferase